MKTCNLILTMILTVTSMQSFANSGGSENGSAASKHSALAASHGTVASAQVGSAVVAIPLIVAGSVGQVSGQLGSKLMTGAIADGPLEITERTITVTPSPKQMMNISSTKEL
jgi:hypothetical protein